MPENAVTEPVADCPHCGKAMPLCICDSVKPMDNRTAILILLHPQEQDRALGTARLTARRTRSCANRPLLGQAAPNET